MRFCRFLPLRNSDPGATIPRYGLVEDTGVRELTGIPWGTWGMGSESWRQDEIRLLAPVAPSKVVCVGRNYIAHAAEMGNEMPKEPLIFLKPPSAIIGPGAAIQLPQCSNRIEHEGELAVVIGRTCSQMADGENPLDYVLGYTCLNDVTARDIQKSDVQFTRAKGFDTFCPTGPYIETHLNPSDALVETRVNGTLRQSSSTAKMAYPVSFLVRWISRVMTLVPGDVVATGTPAGVGPLTAGDTVEVSVAGIGMLRNPVQA